MTLYQTTEEEAPHKGLCCCARRKKLGQFVKNRRVFCLLLKSRLLRPLSLSLPEVELDITVAAITIWLSLALGQNELGRWTKIVVEHAQSEPKLPH